MKYKVLSLLQPWASLVVAGLKRIETRSFNTKHRGLLLIHASLGKKGMPVMDDPAFKKHLTPLYMDDPRNTFPFGAIIGSVNLVSTTQFDKNQPNVEGFSPAVGGYWDYSDQELAFGDYSPGRWGWLLSGAVEFQHAIPAKGKLGIWNWESELPII